MEIEAPPLPAASSPFAGRRIIVIGSTGSGKSTLGQRLAERLDVPFIELDALHWEPGWMMAEPEVFRARVRQATAGPGWVVAGNYSRQQDVTWPHADTVIWLDLPLRVVVPRVVTRSWRRYRTRELLWGTNVENFWPHLLVWKPEKSLIGWALKHHRANRRRNEERMRDPRWAHITFIRLRSSREAHAWLAGVEAVLQHH